MAGAQQLWLSAPFIAPSHSPISTSVRQLRLHGSRGAPWTLLPALELCYSRPERTWRCQSSATGSISNTAQFAKEMERVAAKEALLLAIRDVGGVEAFGTNAATDSGRIDVYEKVLNLERLNPTPRPTTSPLLEGVWNFQWAAAGSPGLRAIRLLAQRFPSGLVKISSLTIRIAGEGAIVVASANLLNSIKTSVAITTKLLVEGPVKIKEEYVEATVESPSLPVDAIPPQLKGFYDQLLDAYKSFPEAVKRAVNDGVRVPLGNTFSRQLLISYLDDEILIARDQTGAPDVLARAGGIVNTGGEEYLS
eukprot:TRINITY_DN14543_c0_g1_i1.p1 TRINITY_DN14543_c0_g1~~TRINITY_DN14543_c0_g1_i1.p1  ORF type:complete len:307 (-),score=31.08 TRINITY_DN14543_c0_g1_i1:1581-2501(-)